MTRLRVGTRGSELALRQTRWVLDLMRAVHAGLEFEEVVLLQMYNSRVFVRSIILVAVLYKREN